MESPPTDAVASGARSANRATALSTTIDQILSSLSNALLLFTLAQTTTVPEFGYAATFVGIVTAWIGFNRGALGTPLLLMSNFSRNEVLAESRHAVAGAVLTGVLGAATLAVTGLLTNHLAMAAAFSVVLPGVLAQDVLRYSAIALGRPQVAALSDATWAAPMLALLCLNATAAGLSAAVSIGIWGAAGIMCAAMISVMTSAWPRLRGLSVWWRLFPVARVRFGTVQTLNTTAATLVTIAVTAFAGAAVTGGLRGASTLFGPIAMLVSALPLVFIPHARRTGQPPAQQWRMLTRVSILTSAATVVLTLFLVLVPEAIGELLLGDTWKPASEVVVYVGIGNAVACWMVGILALFQAAGRSREIFYIRNLQVGLQLAVAIGLAVVVGSVAAIAIGLMAVNVLSVLAGLALVRRALTGPGANSTDVVASAGDAALLRAIRSVHPR